MEKREGSSFELAAIERLASGSDFSRELFTDF
jgi:hypothetical protein